MDPSVPSYQFQQVKSEPMAMEIGSDEPSSDSSAVGQPTSRMDPSLPQPKTEPLDTYSVNPTADSLTVTSAASSGKNAGTPAPIIIHMNQPFQQNKPNSSASSELNLSMPMQSNATSTPAPYIIRMDQPFQPSKPSTNSNPLAGSSSQTPTPLIIHMDQPVQDSAGFALSDLLLQLEDYTPAIPDTVANHFLHTAGFESSDPRISRLVSLAAQKFISDILNDAQAHYKLRTAQPGTNKNKSKDKKYVLAMDDLTPVLADYGITVKKPPYFA